MSTAGLPGPASPLLLGRDRELGILREHLAAARAGRGDLVLIGGEAGIGKTALAEAICQEAERQGVRVLVGRSYDLTETPPYGPWIELFRHYRPDRSLPVPLPEPFAQRGTVGAVASQPALFQQVLDFFTALAAARPLVLLLDDLHWADYAGLDLLRFLARNLSSLPLLLVAAYRTDEVALDDPLYGLLPALVREAKPQRLNLGPLDDDHIRVLVRARYELSAPDETRLTAYLYARTEGNPFFISEILRMLEDEVLLQVSVDGCTLGDVTQVGVPMLVRQVIDRRLARLGDEIRRLLSVAAVIGQDLSLSLWSTIGHVEEEPLLVLAEQAASARFIALDRSRKYARFMHALIRESLYEGLQPTVRRALHRDVGAVLTVSFNPDPDVVAYHFQQASDVRSAEWLIKSGERAQKSWAWITAANRFEAALSVLDRTNAAERARLLYMIARLRQFVDPEAAIILADEAISLATQEGDRALIACATQVRGALLCYVQRIREGLLDLEASALALDALPATYHQRVRVLDLTSMDLQPENRRDGLAAWYALLGRYKEACSLGERLIAQFANMPNEAGHVRPSQAGVYRALGIAYASLGMPDEARNAYRHLYDDRRASEDYYTIAIVSLDEVERVLLPYRADRVSEWHALVAEADTAWNLAGGVFPEGDVSGFAHLLLLALEGRWAEARLLAENVRATKSLAAVRRVATRVLGFLTHHQGEGDRAWVLVHEVLPDGPVAAPGNTRFLDAQIAQQLAVSLALDAGDLPVACAWLEAHDRWLAWSGSVLGRSEGQTLWTRYHRAVGDVERARACATRAFTLASAPRQPMALLVAHRMLGELETHAEQFAVAQDHLDAALALADACAVRYERALTLLVMAELRAATNRRDEAVALLDEARTICTPLGAKPALALADALMLQIALPAAPGYPASLTEREVEVLRLIAAGHTNRQIADKLSLSERTIHVHVRNIFVKTRTDNRAGATAFAFRHDLA